MEMKMSYSQVENLVAIELAYINTKHPDFHRETSLVATLTNAHIDESGHKSQKHSNKKNAVVHPSSIVMNGESPHKDVRIQQKISITETLSTNNPAGAPVNWLTNLLPAGKEDGIGESSAESTPISTPTHHALAPIHASFGIQKPVNLLSEPVPHGRKLSEREQRDCEVIGNF